LIVVVVVLLVVVGAETAGVTSTVVVVLEVGEGMTILDGGKETTPIDEESVGPLGWLRGTKTIPKIPTTINARETTHHIFCEGRFPSRDFTLPNLV
jgi:hypothetical protein